MLTRKLLFVCSAVFALAFSLAAPVVQAAASDQVRYTTTLYSPCSPNINGGFATINDAVDWWWACTLTYFQATGINTSLCSGYDVAYGPNSSIDGDIRASFVPANRVAIMRPRSPCEYPVDSFVTGSCQDRKLSLSGGGQAQPAETLSGFIATVKGCNNVPVSGLEVELIQEAQQDSGSHSHPEPRPQGILTVSGTTDSQGKIQFSFKAPATAGIHKITARCEACNPNPAGPVQVTVKVDGLTRLFTGLYVVEEAGVSTGHPESSRFHLRPDASAKLRALAIAYYTAFDEYLYINDASLLWGGLFDIDANWFTPHKEHRCGRAVDIRGNGSSSTGAIPPENRDEFMKMAKKDFGIDVLPETDPPHFHLFLLGKQRKEDAGIIAGTKTCAQLP